MQLDNIVVLCLALLFFGGIGYLAHKARKKEEDRPPETSMPPKAGNGAPEGRKKRKRRSRG